MKLWALSQHLLLTKMPKCLCQKLFFDRPLMSPVSLEKLIIVSLKDILEIQNKEISVDDTHLYTNAHTQMG